ncbi:MAG: NAD(P)H-hydrate dehydratase [Candidatus Micrarchaeota archaeon]
MNYVNEDVLRVVYPTREKRSHKGQYGKLLVVAGSEMHTGSPIFSAMAAYRAGCDLVYLACPQRPADIAASFSPNLITLPLVGKKLEKKHVAKILELVETSRITAMLIGPGLWRDEQTFAAIYELIEKINLPMVIDADAIRAVALNKKIVSGKKVVFTPHANEFLALSGKKIGEDLEQRINVVQQCSKDLQSVMLLKGNIDVISDGERVALNKTGSVFMTKGGFGDTLAGITGAYLSRGVSVFDAACAAALVNGKAGELCAEKYGESMLASDLFDFIPKVIANHAIE